MPASAYLDVYRFDLVQWDNQDFWRYADSTNTRGSGKLSRGEWIKSGVISYTKNLSLCFYGTVYTSETTSRLILLIPKTDTVLENGVDVPVDTVSRLKLWFTQKGSITVIYQNWSKQANILKQAKTDPDTITHRAEWEDIGGELVANKITANYVNALDITAKRIEVKDSNTNTLFLADGITGSPTANTVQIAGFTADDNSLVSLKADGTKHTVGEVGSVIMCKGSTQTTVPRIGGSDPNLKGWNFTAGNNFGVRTIPTGTDAGKSELYVNKGKIGALSITEYGIGFDFDPRHPNFTSAMTSSAITTTTANLKEIKQLDAINFRAALWKAAP